MTDRELRRRLGEQLSPGAQSPEAGERTDETVRLCLAVMEARAAGRRPWQGFWSFLSDVFRFEGAPLLLSQMAVLLAACLGAGASPMRPYELPMYMPLFVLAAMPAFFRGQRHRVSETEAATRTSTAQLALARLILAGGAALLCVTFLLALEVWLRHSCAGLGRMILYCLVPYLTCMTALLALLRRRRRDGAARCAAVSLGSAAFWRCSAMLLPWLYEASALGLWAAGVLVYGWFFAKEIAFILRTGREMDMYGIAE